MRYPLWLLLVGTLNFASSAWGTSFVMVPFPQTVSETPIMARGKVGNSYSDYGVGSDGTKRLYTFSELKITEVFKGDAPSGGNLVFRELGGTKDGVGMQVAGSAHFDRGEDVLVTLGTHNADGSYDLRGLSTGKYTVQKDADGTEFLVGAGLDTNGEGMMKMAGQSGSPASQRWTLDALRKLVKEQANPRAAVSPDPGMAHSASLTNAPTGASNLDAQAPQLQNSAGSAARPRWLWVAVAGLVSTLGFIVFIVTRK